MELTIEELDVLSLILENSQYGFKVDKGKVTLPRIKQTFNIEDLISLNQKMSRRIKRR